MAMSNIDFYVYGAVVAMTKNTGASHLFQIDQFCECAGIGELQVVSSLKKAQKRGLLNVIFVGDKVCVQAIPVIPEVLRSAA